MLTISRSPAFRLLTLVLGFLILCLDPLPSCASSTAYVVNQFSQTVSAVDLSVDGIAATIPVGTRPNEIVADPSRARIYVLNGGEQSISAIDTIEARIDKTIVLGEYMSGVAVDPAGRHLFVGARRSGVVRVFDLPSLAQTNLLPSGPSDYVMGAGNGRLYLQSSDGVIRALDAETGIEVVTFRIGTTGCCVARLDASGSRVYVTDFSNGTVSGFMTDTGAQVGTISVKTVGYSFATSVDGKLLYVAPNPPNEIVIVDTATFNIVGRFPSPTAGSINSLEADADGTHLYALSVSENALFHIDLRRPEHVRKVPVGNTPVNVALSPDGPRDQLAVVEYYHASFDHYFMTGDPGEIAKLDEGLAGWVRTGQSFPAYAVESTPSSAMPVCRFFSAAFAPRSSHFYTAYPTECAIVKQNASWQFEGVVFGIAVPALDGTCPPDTSPVYRVYNDGQGGSPNHRFVTNYGRQFDMLRSGWIAEGKGYSGVAMCSPGPNPFR
jgi:YVTN family beta-propeller protein